jgi:hypothetical protein
VNDDIKQFDTEKMARRRHKKTFPCGHQGQGKECQRCKQQAKADQDAAEYETQQRLAKIDWETSFEQDAIDLRGLPRHVVMKARRICRDLSQGTHFKHLGGSRFKFDRTIIRIPVGGRYRMLCRDTPGQIVPWQVLSHEDYNAYASNKRQMS